jgi:glucokinase
VNKLQQNERFIVGVDLGDTKIAAALFDASGKLLNRERMETAGTRTAEEVVQRMLLMINQVAQGLNDDVGLVGAAALFHTF